MATERIFLKVKQHVFALSLSLHIILDISLCDKLSQTKCQQLFDEITKENLPKENVIQPRKFRNVLREF